MQEIIDLIQKQVKVVNLDNKHKGKVQQHQIGILDMSHQDAVFVHQEVKDHEEEGVQVASFKMLQL